MKITKEQLKQIIKEELEEGIFDRFKKKEQDPETQREAELEADFEKLLAGLRKADELVNDLVMDYVLASEKYPKGFLEDYYPETTADPLSNKALAVNQALLDLVGDFDMIRKGKNPYRKEK